MWANFFSTVAGAAATLTGLIFVGVSISLSKILSYPQLPNRALQSLILLITVLITALLRLVPGQPVAVAGLEMLSIGVVLWPITLKLDLGMYRNTDPQYRGRSWRNIVLTQLAVLPYIVAGALELGGNTHAIYWLVPGLIFSFIKAALDAWVLLVEIHR